MIHLNGTKPALQQHLAQDHGVFMDRSYPQMYDFHDELHKDPRIRRDDDHSHEYFFTPQSLIVTNQYEKDEWTHSDKIFLGFLILFALYLIAQCIRWAI